MVPSHRLCEECLEATKMFRTSPFVLSIQPSSTSRTRLLPAIFLLAAALTGCNSKSGTPTGESFPSLLGTSQFNGEAVSTLGANYTLPPDSHHQPRLHELHGPNQPRYTHRSL